MYLIFANSALKEDVSGSEVYNYPGEVKHRCTWLGTVMYHYSGV